MNAEENARINIGIGFGLLLQLAGRALLKGLAGPGIAMLGWPLALIGLGVFIWGCCNLAKSKGYSWPLGFVGLLWLIGYLILVLLPHKRRVAG